MSFESPILLILLPCLVLLGRHIGSFEKNIAIRVLVLSFLCLALAGPYLSRYSDGIDLWVLVDVSDSAQSNTATGRDEWNHLLTRYAGSNDRIHYIDFAKEALHKGVGERAFYSGETGATNLSSALLYTLSKISPTRRNKVLVLSDGYSNESLQQITTRLYNAKIPLDYRLLSEGYSSDLYISDLNVPAHSKSDESFLIESTIKGYTNTPIPYKLTRNGVVIHKGTATSTDGEASIRLYDRIRNPSAYRYRLTISPTTDDSVIQNNTAEAYIDIQGEGTVLLLTSDINSGLVRILEQVEGRIEVITDLSKLHPGMLSSRSSVVFDNVPAHEIPNTFLKALPFYVQEQGGSVIMLGGRQSFGSGGYFGSPLSSLLPVSMELKDEHRRYSIALAVVIDRSGSMAMSTNSGFSKIELAGEGVAQAIRLLGQKDIITVFAVDSSPHTIVPLIDVGPNREHLVNTVRKIDSNGGGIFVYNGLKAAWDELQKSKAKQKHIILFSDAADSEQPGEYKSLIKEMVAQKTTISVIGLGTPFDTDSFFLMDISARGKGRMFFTEEANELPVLFAQDTAAVARSSFIDTPQEVIGTTEWREITNTPMNWPAQIGAYNQMYLRKGATVSLVTKDKDRFPLVAYWRRGKGKVASVSFPFSGTNSGTTHQWSESSEFLQTMLRWLARSSTPTGINVLTTIIGNDAHIRLSYTKDWESRIAKEPPVGSYIRDGESETKELVWERIAPGEYKASIPLSSLKAIRGVVQTADIQLPFGPIALHSNPEWQFDNQKRDELALLAQESGGKQLLNFADAWKLPNHNSGRYFLGKIFLILALISLITEVLISRLSWQIPSIHLSKTSWAKKKSPTALKHSEEVRRESDDGSHESNSEVKTTTESEERRSLYKKAKSRK